MLLAIDIGNTHTVLGMYDGKKLSAGSTGKEYFRVASNHSFTVDECGILLKQLFEEYNKIKDVIICSVVPPLTPIYEEMSKKFLKVNPIVVSSDLPLGIKILYDDPKTVGADRLANAVATYEIYGGPAIVVDLGTATTFDVISEKGEYLGGAIAPGIETSSLNLFQKASQLFKVSLEKPKKAIGTNTEESLRSGIIFGAVGQIDEIVNRIKKELSENFQSPKKPKVIATGGLANLVAKESKTIEEINPTLTLEGLRRIYFRVRKIRKSENIKKSNNTE
jgi:type III pantothenate kinase